MVIALLVLLLLMGFVTLAVSRVASETIITSNDAAENETLGATMASLESTTRDFADVFERKLTPTTSDISVVEGLAMPTTGFERYTFGKIITPTKDSEVTEITGGTYAGLFALRSEYQVDITTRDNRTGVETQLRRRFFNDRIPLFQFGIFFEDDLELNRPPLFTFGGRVHTNQNFFITAAPTWAGNGIYFRSKATAVGELVNDIWKTRQGLNIGYDDQDSVFVSDAGGVFRELQTGRGSVNCASPSGTNVFASNPNLPNCSKRSAWDTDKALFQGNLDTNTPRLDLPLFRLNIDLVELVKRGRNVGDMHNDGTSVVAVNSGTQDNAVVARERFANKPGLRVSMADSKTRLPGCSASGANPCGVRLDAAMGASIGYLPVVMSDGYQATALNATRFGQTSKEVWIKIDLVNFDYNNDIPIITDITQDFLSLGFTERAPISNNFKISGYGATGLADNNPAKTDVRSIVKLQRFTISGTTITDPAGSDHIQSQTIDGVTQNFVRRYTNVTLDPASGCSGCTPGNNFASPLPSPSSSALEEDSGHLKWATVTGGGFNLAITPFPIQIFDTREGVPNDRSSYTDTVPGNDVTRSGVMSLIDIDIANLRKFLNGDFNGSFPTTTPYATTKGSALVSGDVAENSGWVLYISDRRGDQDFDGEYDMEDVFPDGLLQFNEDVNGNNTLERRLFPVTNWEAPSYTDTVVKSRAATSDHGYYRRGVRLINGTTLPGIYDATNPDRTLGFTVASENGVYVKGNYNATSVTLPGGSVPAPSQNYFPQGTQTHIPAAIVADAVTILSNAWQDSRSFRFPFAQESRVASATQVRFALLSGDGITGNTSITYSPSQFGMLNGGIHNFKRYLERWSGVRLNYAGSLVNLFSSRNNNGFWKCCSAVYNPPIRDWTFDTTFLDPNRLPPGTPYIYSLTFTGFQRVNN